MQGAIPKRFCIGIFGLKKVTIHSSDSKTKERIYTAEVVVGIIENTVSNLPSFRSS